MRNPRHWTAVDLSLLPLAAALLLFSPSAAHSAVPGSIRFVYFIPSDRTFQTDFHDGIESAAADLQEWYLDQLAGKTITLNQPVVEQCQGSQPESYYTTSSYSRVFDAVNVCFPTMIYDDPDYRWVIYADVRHTCNAPERLGAGGSGVTIMPVQDLEGLAGRPTIINDCGDSNPYVGAAGIHRWIGGLGHELGHALGLNHPPGCDQSLPGCDSQALMWAGYASYPNTYLRDDDKAILLAGPFFTADTTLRFAGTNAGGNLVVTAAQTVGLDLAGGDTWSATSDQSWLTVSPASGVGASTVSVEVVGPSASLPATGTLRATITIDSSAVDSYIDVVLSLVAAGSTVPPFGSFDTPTDGTTGATGAIGVTGWALDDVGIDRLELWRDPVNGDPPPAPNGKIFIGNATFVSGARPDVQGLYPTYPNAARAAWGYMLLTNLLPNAGTGAPAGGVGTFTLYAYVYDIDGRMTTLPTRTFTTDNTVATKPFGTIDTPGQGETVSGIVNNFGWVLTPQPGTMPTDGSTIRLFIDSVPLGTATYNAPRSDLATLFPGYNNTSGPVGLFSIDTTTLANGVHTIAWSATDDLARADGIGSRYFTVLN